MGCVDGVPEGSIRQPVGSRNRYLAGTGERVSFELARRSEFHKDHAEHMVGFGQQGTCRLEEAMDQRACAS
jgi:hypothetical protein